MIKKLLVMMLIFITMFAFVACDGTTADPDDEDVITDDTGIISETGAVSLFYWDANDDGKWVDSGLDSNNTDYSLKFEFNNGIFTLYVNGVEIGNYNYSSKAMSTKITEIIFNSENNGREYTVEYGIPVITAGSQSVAVSTETENWGPDRTEPEDYSVDESVVTVTTSNADLDDFYRYQGVKTEITMNAEYQWTLETSISFEAADVEISRFAPSVWLNVSDEDGTNIDWSIIRIQSNAVSNADSNFDE